MTNGEMIIKEFPNAAVFEMGDNQLVVVIFDRKNERVDFNKRWWNAEYKEPTAKENLVVEDAVSRKAVITIIQNHWWNCRDIDKLVNELPPVKPQPCEDSVSRKAINGYIDYILSHGMGKKKSFDFIKKFVANLPSVTPQKPKIVPIAEIKYDEDKLKSMVEIDLYSVIKQKYIEREVLDKIRAEIEKLQKMCDKNDLNLLAQYSAFGMVLDILDKYKAESEE